MPKLPKITLFKVAAFLILALGMLIGAWIGGNYATDFQFNGVRGYEATAQIGFFFSLVVLLIVGFFARRTKMYTLSFLSKR